MAASSATEPWMAVRFRCCVVDVSLVADAAQDSALCDQHLSGLEGVCRACSRGCCDARATGGSIGALISAALQRQILYSSKLHDIAGTTVAGSQLLDTVSSVRQLVWNHQSRLHYGDTLAGPHKNLTPCPPSRPGGRPPRSCRAAVAATTSCGSCSDSRMHASSTSAWALLTCMVLFKV